MVLFKKLLHCKKGLETVTAIFMLLIMFTVVIGMIIGYVNYNLSAQEQLNVEDEHSSERITLSKGIDGNEVKNVTVKNIGTNDVVIRGIYVDDDGVFSTFDPSLDMNTILVPTASITIPLTVSVFKEARIVATTQRGTRSIDVPPPIDHEEPPPPDTNEFYMGSLLLQFDNFFYKTFTGSFIEEEGWDDGWVVQSNPSRYCAWKIGITNIGDKDITLNSYSCFSTFPSGSTDYRSWFLWTSDGNNLVDLHINQTVSLFFVRSSPGSSGYVKLYSNEQICMVFLTFYGTYQDDWPYAQTIPFEAAITVE
jgi:hypothetical protein